MRNINNLRYADDTTLMTEVKEESEKFGLKLNIQKTKIMASGPITSWEIDGETVETMTDFIFLGSKITADGDCSHEIKRLLLLGRKVTTNLPPSPPQRPQPPSPPSLPVLPSPAAAPGSWALGGWAPPVPGPLSPVLGASPRSSVPCPPVSPSCSPPTQLRAS